LDHRYPKGRHYDGLVSATAISANPADPRIQNEVDDMLRNIQQKCRIVKSVAPSWMVGATGIEPPTTLWNF
jgi:hypothetical protein